MKDMNNYSTYDDNDYRAPWLKLNKEQKSDPFGWLLSQRHIDVRAILLKMGYNDRQIGFLLYPNQIADKKPGFLQARQRIGQKAVQTYLKWVFDNEVKKNKIKLGESQLRKIVAESVKKVLSEIDWKTYANAANKRRKQYRDEIKNGIDSDKWDRAQELDNAASRALSDKFGKNLKTWGDNWNGETGDRHVMDADAPWTTGTNAMGPEPTGYYYTSSKDRNWRNGSDEYQNGDYDLYGDIPLDFKNQSEEDKQNNNIGREIDNFTHDRYAYDNEKGWHLKESVEKAVKSVLKEYINKK